MLNALLGRKVGMTQVFGQNGTVIPVTIIEVGPCVVTQVKTVAHDGYEAVQIGFEQATTKHITRPQLGHLGHRLPLLKGQRESLREYRQNQKAQTSEEGNQAEETEKPGKQLRKLLKIEENRQRRPGPELGPFKVLREVGLQEGASTEGIELGAKFDAGLFRDGEAVDIIGTSKGKGFQGV